jgi:hypothetical protein
VANVSRRAPPTQQQRKTEDAKPERPVHAFQRGRLKAAVWRHEATDGPWHSVTFARTYRKPDGSFASASSYGRDDLLVIAELARKAWDWICSEQTVARAVDDRGDSFEGEESIPA